MTVAEATAKLTSHDLVVVIDGDDSDDAIVTDQSEFGITVDRGTAITLSTKADYPTVTLSCDHDSFTDDAAYTLDRTPSGTDFTDVWAERWYACAVEDTRVTPTTDAENAVYAAAGADAGYDDFDISTLYEDCARVDKTDPILTMDGISDSQYDELGAMLMLCPAHPLADDYIAVLKAFDSGDRMDNRDERAWRDLPADVLAMFDDRTINRSSDMLQVYCLPGLETEMSEVLASGIAATEDQARAYLRHVCP